MDEVFDQEIIAPCGMNCGICMAYLREKNKCPGCRTYKSDKPDTRSKCIIKNCVELKKNNWKFCIKCSKLPCQRMKNLDKRYRTKYDMSMMGNLKFIEEKGIKSFLKQQKEKYKCPNCGGVICVHNKKCYSCEV